MLTPGRIVLLVFACLFVTVTGVFLTFEVITSFGTIDAIFFGNNTLGDVIGGLFLWIITIILGFCVVGSAVVTLPFAIVLMKKVGKRWYAMTLLIFTLSAIGLAVILAIAMPVISLSGGGSSTSSSASSAIALVL